MGYNHACFISYKRPPKKKDVGGLAPAKPPKPHFWLQFAEEFQRQLEPYLNTTVRSFRDEQLQPGSNYPSDLSVNLCRSVCMVALVVPEYFESPWCTAEWNAMAAFEAKRLGQGKHGLIIPVTCVGDPDTLRPLFGPRQDVDLRNIVNPIKQLSSIRSLTKIKAIADTVNKLAKTVPAPDIECDNFSLGVGADEMKPMLDEPSPFSR